MTYTQAHVDALHEEIARLKAELEQVAKPRRARYAVYRDDTFGPVRATFEFAEEWEAHRECYALQEAADCKGISVRYYVKQVDA